MHRIDAISTIVSFEYATVSDFSRGVRKAIEDVKNMNVLISELKVCVGLD